MSCLPSNEQLRRGGQRSGYLKLMRLPKVGCFAATKPLLKADLYGEANGANSAFISSRIRRCLGAKVHSKFPLSVHEWRASCWSCILPVQGVLPDTVSYASCLQFSITIFTSVSACTHSEVEWTVHRLSLQRPTTDYAGRG